LVLSEYKHSGYHKMSWKYNKLLLKYINYYLRNKLKKNMFRQIFVVKTWPILLALIQTNLCVNVLNICNVGKFLLIYNFNHLNLW
jgi:hypothetical protein